MRAFGLLVLSKSVLQQHVSTSVAIAEVQGQTTATKEAVWFRIFMLELLQLTRYEDSKTGLLKIPVFGDNMAALKFGREHCTSSRMKSVPLAYYYCYEQSSSGKVSYHQIPTLDNIGDFWTKAHGAAELERHRSKWMVKWARAKRIFSERSTQSSC